MGANSTFSRYDDHDALNVHLLFINPNMVTQFSQEEHEIDENESCYSYTVPTFKEWVALIDTYEREKNNKDTSTLDIIFDPNFSFETDNY